MTKDDSAILKKTLKVYPNLEKHILFGLCIVFNKYAIIPN